MTLFHPTICSEKAAHASEIHKIEHSFKVNHIAKHAINEAGELSVDCNIFKKKMRSYILKTQFVRMHLQEICKIYNLLRKFHWLMI